MSFIEIKNVSKVFGNYNSKTQQMLHEGKSKDDILNATGATVAVKDVSLSIDEKEIFVIMGLSGSGKSTLIRLINHLIPTTEGQIIIKGEDISAMDKKNLRNFRRKNLSMVFQSFALFPFKTVLRNAAFGLEVKNISRKTRLNKAKKALALVGLNGYENQYPRQLSGGMQQRVGLARALANDTDILLMDEAFSALDPLIRKDMQNELLQLQKDMKKTIIFITHDLDEALHIGDRIALMKDGALAQVGTPLEIVSNPADEYVARFVRDVNQAKVLTLKQIMIPIDNSDRQFNYTAESHQLLDTVFGYFKNGEDVIGVTENNQIVGMIDTRTIFTLLDKSDDNSKKEVNA